MRMLNMEIRSMDCSIQIFGTIAATAAVHSLISLNGIIYCSEYVHRISSALKTPCSILHIVCL